MEDIDIVLILVATVITIVLCGTCIVQSQSTNRQRALSRFNMIMPVDVETEHQRRSQREVSQKTEESGIITHPTGPIIISCL